MGASAEEAAVVRANFEALQDVLQGTDFAQRSVGVLSCAAARAGQIAGKVYNVNAEVTSSNQNRTRFG